LKLPVPAYNMAKYLTSNLLYPDKARRKNIEGRVDVYFLVDKTGHIRNPVIAKSTNTIFNWTTLDTVRSMPPWKPGMEDDELANVSFTQPILFRLPD